MPTDNERRRLADVMRRSSEGEKAAYSAMLERGSVELYQVDRDALLALADEMDGLCGPWHDCGKHYARRIREVCEEAV